MCTINKCKCKKNTISHTNLLYSAFVCQWMCISRLLENILNTICAVQYSIIYMRTLYFKKKPHKELDLIRFWCRISIHRWLLCMKKMYHAVCSCSSTHYTQAAVRRCTSSVQRNKRKNNRACITKSRG